MKTRFLLTLLLGLAGVAVGALPAADTPAVSAELVPSAVLATMERVADWQNASSSRQGTGWKQGAYYTGVMALAEISPSPRFDDAMMKMAERNQWKLGRKVYMADDHCVGQTYAELYLRHRDPKMIAPMRAQFDAILASPKPDDFSFDPAKKDRTDTWSWCDALFMAPPAWIRLHVATGEKKYLDFMVDTWWKTSAHLYDKEEHLFFRDDTFFPKREANGKKVFWGRGNGWVMGGLVRVLQLLPADHPARPRFVQQFQEMAEVMLKCQQPDGLWRSSLLDPESYPAKETSGSGFHTYAFAWGVRNGLLDRARFEPAAKKAWQALVGCVTPDGKLTYAQPVGSDPKKNFGENSNQAFGTGGFLLAGSEIYRLLGGSAPAAPKS